MSLLQDVVDLNNVASFNPLTFDYGTTFLRGADAILRRVLYLWCTPLGRLRHAPGLGVSVPIPDLPGWTFSPFELQGLRQNYEAQAKEVAFVDEARVLIAYTQPGAARIASAITLTDNKAYALELSITEARPVLLRLGSQTA